MTNFDDKLNKELRDIAERHGLMFDDYETVQKAADRLEAQAKDIEELRAANVGVLASWKKLNTDIAELRTARDAARDSMRHIRVQFVDLLREALTVIAPFADRDPGSVIRPYHFDAAHRFAKKHGGKDD